MSKTKGIKFKWVFLIALLPGFGISFITPIYQFDYGTHTTGFKPKGFERLDQFIDLNLEADRKKKLVVFFTTTCPHCKNASEELGYNMESGQKIKVNAIFPNKGEAINTFIKNNNGSTFNPFGLDNDALFLELSGGYFPSLFLLDENNEVISNWSGDGINYTCLDYLKTIEP